jgi:hypothetical protein
MTTQKSFDWTTQKGSKITVTIEINHITEKEVNLDGDKFTTKTSAWTYRIASLSINGKSEKGELSYYQGNRAIKYGEIKQAGKLCPLLVLVPENVVKEVYGTEQAEIAEKAEASRKADTAYETYCAMMAKAMEE